LLIYGYSTSGVPFHSTPVSVAIPPNSFCPVNLSGVAEKPGILTIRGCHVQPAGCETKEFLLPLSTDEEDLKMEKRKSMQEAEADRFKYSGLEARPNEKEKMRLSMITAPGNTESATPAVKKDTPAVRFIECRVVPELPFLRIRRTSLTHGAVMLYDGERYEALQSIHHRTYT
jgi:trafficking protein particle complex subunit 9